MSIEDIFKKYGLEILGLGQAPGTGCTFVKFKGNIEPFLKKLYEDPYHNCHVKIYYEEGICYYMGIPPGDRFISETFRE